ncbi:MAG: FAD-dependent oxidoreductase [Dermatophilaceae bacterium]
MQQPRPRRIAIVGAGPSGLFAAQALVGQDALSVEVHLYDRLPTPYGLLRYGVAPDHQNIKAVAATLAKTFDNDAVRFVGNVELGANVSRAELLAAYDAVVYAIGAPEDLRMGIPGEDLPGSRAAREFVEWYSGHPDATPQDLTGVSGVATIGVGNVAVDVARVLAKDAAALHPTDMPDPVLDELDRHDVKDIWLVARRGPQHAAFTTVELRELVNTPGLAIAIDPQVLEGIDEEGLERRVKGNLKVLREAATKHVDSPRRTLHFAFWRRPVALLGAEHVESLVLERTQLDTSGRVVGTGERDSIPLQLVLRAIGYRSVAFSEVPFDEAKGVVHSIEGRVCHPTGALLTREYVVGWLKRGPTGVIGTNKSDAAQTMRHLVADLSADPDAPAPSLDLDTMLASRTPRPTTMDDWRAIDAAEIAMGAQRGKPRSKVSTWQEMLDLCAHGEPAATPVG